MPYSLQTLMLEFFSANSHSISCQPLAMSAIRPFTTSNIWSFVLLHLSSMQKKGAC